MQRAGGELEVRRDPSCSGFRGLAGGPSTGWVPPPRGSGSGQHLKPSWPRLGVIRAVQCPMTDLEPAPPPKICELEEKQRQTSGLRSLFL